MPESADFTIPHAPNLDFEQNLWVMGVSLVAGVDEAGRGAIAGPVSAAAVILPEHAGILDDLSGVRDSKQMTPLARERWAEQIRQVSLAHAVGYATHAEIDRLGIVPATLLAIRRALGGLSISPEHILVDYLQLLEAPCPSTPLVKGDARSLTIAAASVLAKTGRDAIMRDYEHRYPGYGFGAHKGYGTRAHRLALAERGPSPVHRLSFQYKPVEART